MGAPLITISVALSVVAMVAVVVACLLSRRALRQRLETETSSDAGHLHEAEIAVSRLAGALDAIPQGVVICDDTGREVFRNQVAIAYVRSRHGEALVEQAIQEQFVAVRGAGAALRTLDLYGPPRRVLLLSAVDLRDGLQPAGALVLVDDVSERRRLEAVRRDFVVNITHELKTPVGALGLLADTIAAEIDAQVVRRLAERMTEEAFRV
ncbi:MAG: two-component sensor histidine kinase, partial [Actinomycetota bacterium]|nr:two-component sensor histidine kinase [Actinomycetota bacterium]